MLEGSEDVHGEHLFSAFKTGEISSTSLCPKEQSESQGLSYLELSEGHKVDQVPGSTKAERFESKNKAPKKHV